MTKTKHLKTRVYQFTRRDGSKAVNTTAYLYPFRDMEVGDWFDIAEADCERGGLATLCSVTGKRMQRVFSMKPRKVAGGYVVLRVTRLDPEASKPPAPVKPARPSFPLRTLEVGESFETTETVKALRLMREVATETGRSFTTQRTQRSVRIKRTG